MASRSLFRLSLLLPGFLLACGDGGAGPEAASSVSLSVTTGFEGEADPTTWSISDGDHELVLHEARLVVREVALAGSVADQPLETGPFLLDLPLGRPVASWMARVVPSGRYDRLRLALHEPDGGRPSDAAFLADHPGLEGVSVRVAGSWDGAPFVVDLGLDDTQVVLLRPPLEVDGRTANVTLRLDVASWFRGPDGSLVDPALAVADTAAAAALEARIRASVSAYEDPDADGTAGDD